jgi:hypothetical protein
MGRNTLQVVWWRRRASAPVPGRNTAVPCSRFWPGGYPRTAAQDQRFPDMLLPRRRGRRHTGAVLTLPRSGAGKHTEGGFTTPLRQCSRGAVWWNGPGPALSRGPFLDGLKTDSTMDRGRAAKRCGHTAPHRSWNAERHRYVWSDRGCPTSDGGQRHHDHHSCVDGTRTRRLE